MSFETITCEIAEQILTVTLNRPDKLNAFNATMQRELIEAFDAANRDDDIRAIIVTGAGRVEATSAGAPAPGKRRLTHFNTRPDIND